MESNVFIFHGTQGYPEENWFPWMKNELEKQHCRVFVSQFPSPPVVPAKISEWFDVLKTYETHINDGTIIIGHSLGGKFLLRVLENLRHSLKAACFVGTPIGIPPIANNERDNAFTGNDFDWATIKRNAGYCVVYQSDNDPYVGLSNGEELAKNLGVELSFVPNAGHFNTKAGFTTFEDLRDKILNILHS
jgi:predicted alpha/beta hydrolase family esterase